MANKVRAVMHWLKGKGAEEIRERKEASHEGLCSPSYNLQEILDSHRLWLQSKKKGAKADLSNRRIDALGNADLREADIHSANLSGADLRNTNLQRANLSQANLSKANLHGTIFREANLQGADLTDATGLLPGQLAGADVSNARMPANFPLLVALENVKEISDSAQKVFLALLVGCIYCWLTLMTMSHVQLLTDSTALPLPIVQTPVPILSFFWVAPVLLLGVYIYLHLYLQRLWEGLAELPAVFPDGRTLAQRAPSWLLNGLVSTHISKLREKRRPFARVQTWIAVILAWWMVPVTLLIFCIRYLPRHDRNGTIFLLVLLGVALAWGCQCYIEARTTLQGHVVRRYVGLCECVGAGGICLMLYCVASVALVPPVCASKNPFSFMDFKKSFMDLIVSLGTAHLEDADISTKPVNWTGMKEEELLLVKGARLVKRNLRCMRASSAFLDKADLFDTDLRGANLLFARLQKANLVDAHLEHADLSAAYLRCARLNNAHLEHAHFRGAKLMYADLRGAKAMNAGLELAKLQHALLTSADLTGAWLMGADLTGATLAGATLVGADLDEAVLTDVNFMDADLTEATNLTQAQIDVTCINAKTKLPPGLTPPALCSNPPRPLLCPDPPLLSSLEPVRSLSAATQP